MRFPCRSRSGNPRRRADALRPIAARSAPAYAGAMGRIGLVALCLIVSAPAAGQTASAADHACTCRFKDRRVALGDQICLDTAAGRRLAMCVMNQNLPFYAISDEGCAVSLAASPRATLR
jgi:hypothetical protein